MPERRRYKNPPIEEALCEFRFEPSQDWDLTIPGKVHSELGEEYTSKLQKERVAGEKVILGERAFSHLYHGGGFGKVQLFSSDGRRVIGIGHDILSVHMLCPYQDPTRSDGGGWGEFQSRITAALSAYWKVADPAGVCRVDIRYINNIETPEGETDVKDYLKCVLPDVEGLPNHPNNFVSQVDYDYGDGIRLVFSQGLMRVEPSVAVLLDLDFIWETSESVGQDEALEKANHLRNLEREAFESIITNKSREIFDGG